MSSVPSSVFGKVSARDRKARISDIAVVAEGVALPLVHTAWITAVTFTVLNAGLLTVRIRVEAAALHGLAPADA